jgi:ubiquinone/menaquinone biosynthesis C-methylase UbiE
MAHPDKTKIAVDAFNKAAKVYQDKFMDTGMYHESFDIFCGKLKVGASVLDVACGPGNISSYLLHIRPDLNILGIDLAPAMVTLAKDNAPAAEFRLMDIRDINILPEKYDAIICGFGFPYLSKKEAQEFIGDASGVLAYGGILFISTMEDDYSKSGWQTSGSGAKIFMHYHQADYLQDFLQNAGFGIIELRRIEYVPENGNPVCDLVIIAEKKDTDGQP